MQIGKTRLALLYCRMIRIRDGLMETPNPGLDFMDELSNTVPILYSSK